jgi:hypothetical protein
MCEYRQTVHDAADKHPTMLLLDKGLARALQQHQYTGAYLSVLVLTETLKRIPYGCELLS